MIELKNIAKKYEIIPDFNNPIEYLKSFFKKKEYKLAIEDISFTVKDGEFVGLIGPNGAGKSTLVKILSGIISPTSGSINIDGIIPYKTRIKYTQKIGVVFGQKTQLNFDLPVIDTFRLMKDIYSLSYEEYQQNLKNLINLFEIEDLLDKQARTLSLGQRVIVDIALSLLHNPKILFLDEPTIGLDLFSKEKIRKALKKINEQNKMTIILTSHDLEDMDLLCNRYIIINKGNIVFDGSNLELKKNI